MARAGGNSFYRIIRDQNQLAVYAYQLVFDLSGNGSAVMATAQPYDNQFVERFPYADAGKPTPTLSAPAALGPITSGHSARIDLFSIPGMGLEVSETISVRIDHPSRGGSLRFSGLNVFLNGKQVAGGQQQSVSGRFAMFYVPRHGAYFFATSDPGHGFLKSGTISGDRMSFTIDNDQYDAYAGSPILGTQAPSGDLWVLHDPDYRPGGSWTAHRDSNVSPTDQFFAAASDSLSWWLK